MRIEPKVQSHLQLHSTSSPIPTKTPRLQTFFSSFQESAAAPDTTTTSSKSPLYVVIDLFNCAKFFVIAHVQAFARKVFSCLFKQKPNPGPVTQTTPAQIKPTATPPVLARPPVPHAGAATPRQPALQIPAPPPQPAPSAAPSGGSVADVENAAFNALAISSANKEDIAFIVHTLATQFVLPAGELTAKGHATRLVHPLRFLEHILKTPSLAQDFAALKSRPSTLNLVMRLVPSMVWNEFSSTLSQKLEAQDTAGQLACYINAFARSVGRDPNEMRTHVTSKNWMGLIAYLIDTISAEPVASAPLRPASGDSTARPVPPLPLPQPLDAEGHRVRVSPQVLPPPVLEEPERSRSEGDDSFPLPSAGALDRPAARPAAAIRLDPGSLPMNEAQKAILRNTISAIAHSNYVSLLWQIRTLRANWEELRNVHPFKILLTIFSEQLLYSDFQRILSDPLKKEEFLKDLAKTLKHGALGTQPLESYLHEFTTQLGCGPADIRRLIITNSTATWKEAVLFLFRLKQLQTVPLTAGSPGT